METATFIFTCRYQHGVVASVFRDKGIEIKGDLKTFLNAHLPVISGLLIPHVNPGLIAQVDVRKSPQGHSLLVFYTRPLRYSRYRDDYLVITRGTRGGLPVIMAIRAQMPNCTMKVETGPSVDSVKRFS